MQKTKLPPVDMRHVCKYTDDIIEKLKKKNWSYHKSLNMWVNSANVCGFLHQKDSFEQKTETNNNKEFFNLPKQPYKTWNKIGAIACTAKNSVIHGISPEWIIEILRVLRPRYNKKVLRDIILGFPLKDDVVIVFVPYRNDYARFVIAPMLLEKNSYYETKISGTSYIEPSHLFCDIKTGIIGPLYKGKIITMDDYKAKWVEHILSDS